MQVRGSGLGEDPPALLGVRAVEADDHRKLELHLVERLQDPARDLVAARDAAEDVEEDRLHLRILRDHGERIDDSLRVAAAAEVTEVGGPASREGDHVDRRHRQSGAVAADADLAVELHVGDVLGAGERLERVGRILVAHLRDLGVPVERVVVHRELRVERLDDPVGRHDQRVHLAQHRVEADERVVELADDLRDLLLLRRIRNKRACLDTDGIRYVLERVARMVTENGGTWNQEWSSRALRAIFMQGEPAADAAIVGHGEFIAAMLFHGFAAMFTPDTETDCLFKVSPSKRFLQSLK